MLASKDQVELGGGVLAGLARSELRSAYAACREITRVASKTFYLASLFLAPEKRRAIWAIYAFCRTADDLVDRAAPEADRLGALDGLERSLLAALDGSPDDPTLAAYADSARRFAIPLAPALALLRGARMDITIRRYATYDSLCEYCYLVASTVGLLVTPVLGSRSERANGYGVVLGRAMQLTNILRDIGEDAEMGRIYLPAEDLARFGYDEERLLEQVVDAPFVALMRFQIARVRTLYAEAEPGIALLAPDSRYTVRVALSLYREILERIELNRYEVFRRRAFVPLRSKLATAVSLALIRS